MSRLTEHQPVGTPTWIELPVPDLAAAQDFYRALFGWDYGLSGGGLSGGGFSGGRATALLRGLPVAGLTAQAADPAPGWAAPGWTMYLAVDDCDAAAAQVTAAGGTLLAPPADDDGCRTALASDPVGARFGLWQARGRIGCELVNEPDTLVRNDLVTPAPGPARAFYTAVFGYTLDGNDDLPGADFSFLRRPDGKEIGGILGSPDAAASTWATTFEVADTAAVAERARAAGGTAGEVTESPYGRFAELTDPFGTRFSIIARY